MKKNIIIIASVLVAVLLVGYFFLGGKELIAPSTPKDPLPSGNNSGNTQGNPLGQTGTTVVEGDNATTLQVARDFRTQYNNPSAVLDKTVVVHPYALLSWHDENVAATSILHYSSNGQWVLVGGEGGVIDEQVLVYFGVPFSVAKKLMEAWGE